MPALAGDKLSLFRPTRIGMRQLAEQIRRARPDTIVIASPHNLRLKRRIGVVVSENSSGFVREGGKEIRLRAKCDTKLAEELAAVAESRGLPVVAANYGVFEGPLSDLPMDWGTLIPLWFFIRQNHMKCKVVIVTPSREIPLKKNFEFGKVVAEVAERKRKRVAFVASSDQAHAHSKKGPYGFSPRAGEYDRLVVEAIRDGRLNSILEMDEVLVEEAKPDSLWQMAILAGVLSVVPMSGELISYQVPTYYGMICAGYVRRP